jgi:hypothetical protein
MGGSALVVAACVGVSCAVFYIQLRHWIFALPALVPPIAVFSSAALLRQNAMDQALIAALFGTLCALSLGDQMIRGVSAGLVRRELASKASRFVMFAAGPVFTAYLLSLCADALILDDWHTCATIALLFAVSFAVAFAGLWFCAFVPFSEQFVARANAARERRARMLEHFFPTIQPRWAFSMAGISVVLGAIAVFGIRDAHVHWIARIAYCFPLGLFFALMGFGVIAREWRMTAALILATLFSGTLLFWAFMRRDPYPDLFSMGAMLALSSVPLNVIAARARQYMREGDDTASALAAAIRCEGATAVALGAILGLTGLLATATYAALSPALVFALSSMFAALLLFPALTITIYTLFPRYRTVDEVFGRR